MTGKGRRITYCFLLAGLMLLPGCGEKQAVLTETVIESVESSLSDERGITLYYVNGSTIEAEKEKLQPKQPDSVTGCLEEVMNAMTLTAGVSFDGYDMGVDNAVTLYFTIGDNVNRETTLLEKASVVSTVSQIRNIGSITISSTLPDGVTEEEELKSGSFYYYDAVVPTGQNNGRITLYLPKEGSGELEPVTLAVQLQLDVSVEEEVVRQLIQRNVFAEGTKLLSVSVAQKVAYVDLSPEFEKGCTRQQVAILVDSVAELPHISSVQLLIDGEKRDTIGDMDTHVPLRSFDPEEVPEKEG